MRNTERLQNRRKKEANQTHAQKEVLGETFTFRFQNTTGKLQVWGLGLFLRGGVLIFNVLG